MGDMAELSMALQWDSGYRKEQEGREPFCLLFFSKFYILSTLLFLSRIMPGSCREDRMPPDIGPSPQNVRV